MACLVVLGSEQFPAAITERIGTTNASGKMNHKCMTLFRFQCLLHACFFLPDAVLIFVPRDFVVHVTRCTLGDKVNRWPLADVLIVGLLSVAPGGEKSLLISGTREDPLFLVTAIFRGSSNTLAEDPLEHNIPSNFCYTLLSI
jgi:hypothetical protein